MLKIFADTFRSATLSTSGESRDPVQLDDTKRRYPWRGNRWGDRRHTRVAQRRMNGMSDHMLQDLGITRANIDGMFD